MKIGTTIKIDENYISSILSRVYCNNACAIILKLYLKGRGENEIFYDNILNWHLRKLKCI